MKNFALQKAQYNPTNKYYTRSQGFKFKCRILIFIVAESINCGQIAGVDDITDFFGAMKPVICWSDSTNFYKLILV
jgi:hypothetical protein